MNGNVIFCYSGTGNCLDMAKNLARNLGGADIVMMRRAPAVTDVREAKRVGFIFPCYAGGLPGEVEDFVRRVRVGAQTYTFGVCQCAAYMGTGLRRIDEIIHLDFWSVVSHQCSCIWLFPHTMMLPMLSAPEAQRRSEKKAAELASAILAGRRSEKRPPKRALNAIECSVWPALAKKKAAAFVVSDKCIGCGQCASLCPRGNIRVDNGRAVIGGDCIQCLGCLQYCPQGAISLGKLTQKRERYHNPHVTPEELGESVIHIE